MSSDCTIPVNTNLPLKKPYRTGAYLSYDYPSDQTDDHFRMFTTLIDHPYRASGSRQLDQAKLTSRLQKIATHFKPALLFLVDLRQESHVFANGRAVSWYADRDWANVGRSESWILENETKQIKRLTALPSTQIFCTHVLENGDVMPTGYSEVSVKSASTEFDVAQNMKLACPLIYFRIPVTDHCMPDRVAEEKFVELSRYLYRQPPSSIWVHFHCHGGDGRTTTSLAMYDMVCWKKSGTGPLPPLKEFADRQRTLFKYELDPGNCSETADWQCALFRDRWDWLEAWREWVIKGGLATDEPSNLKRTI
jgi:hypothetical protein